MEQILKDFKSFLLNWKIIDFLKFLHNIDNDNFEICYKNEYEKNYKDIEIVDFNLSIRSTNCLLRNKIETFLQLINLNVNELKKLRNLGNKCFYEILNHLCVHTIFLDKLNSQEKIDVNLNNNIHSKKYLFFHNISNKKETFLDCIKKVNQQDIYLIFKILDIYYDDYEIKKINFSERTKNCLIESKIYTLKELINTPLNKIQSIGNLGKKSFQEILEWLQNNSMVIESNENNYFLQIKKMLLNINNKYVQQTINLLCKIIWENTKDKKIGEINFDNFNNIKDDLNFIMNNNVDWNQYIDNFILWTIKTNNKLTFLQIQELIPKIFINSNDLLNKINNLIQNQLIIYNNDFYWYRYPNFEIFLSNFDINERWMEIIINRILKGETLEQIGKKQNVTRERIRQIVNKIMKQKNEKVWEDLFSNLFEEYNMDKNAVQEILNLNENSYNYLNICYQKGNKNLVHLIDDYKYDEWIRNNTEKYINKKYIKIDNKFVKKSNSSIINYLLKTKCLFTIKFSDFLDMYKKFLKECNLNFKDYNFRGLANRFALYDFILWKPGQKFRYYDINQISNVNVFFNNLNLYKFNNKEISTKIIFDSCKNLMNEFNILDEYELHDLMKKLYEKSDKSIKISFSRTPIISIGNANREKQTINFLIDNNHISAKEFSEKYEKTYGVKKQNVYANFLKFIEKFKIKSGYYEFNKNLI